MSKKKELGQAPRPQIILTDVTPSLEFSTEGSMKLEIDVKCLNLDLSKCDVIIDCKAFGVGNNIHESITEPNFLEGILSIHLLNSCSGCTVTTKVTAHKKITGPIKFYLPDDKLAEAEIVLKPTSKKKVGKVNWSIPNNNASNLSQGSPIADFDVELFGYNGEELLLIKNILEKGKVVFERLTSISVRENNISSKFFKSDCFTQAPDTEMTLAFQLFYKGEQLVFDDNTMTQKRDITLQKYQGVEKITSFPIQPVVVGQRDIIDKTFSPAEQQAERIQAMESAVDSNSAAQSIVNELGTNVVNADTTEEESVEEALKVEILDDNKNPVTKDFELFVNLPRAEQFLKGKDNDGKDIIWKDSTGADLEGLYQLGNTITCRITFAEKKVHNFKLKIIADSNNIEYSPSEKKRNTKFTYQEKELKLTTNSSGICEITSKELFLSHAGGCKYHLLVKKDNRKKAKSVTITTWRKLFYQEVKMKQKNQDVLLENIPPNLNYLREKLKKHYIDLVSMPEEIHIDYIDFKTMSIECDGNSDSVFSKVEKIIEENISKKYPFRTTKEGSRLFIDDIEPVIITYIEKFIELKKISKKTNSEEIYISQEELKMYDSIDSITGITNNNTVIKAVEGTLQGCSKETPLIMEVNNNKIDRFYYYPKVFSEVHYNIFTNDTTGFSINDANITVIATERIEAITEVLPFIKRTIVHELGHNIGMLSDGTQQLETQDTYDITSENHCYVENCVMYKRSTSKHHFCRSCTTSMQKLDLSNRYKNASKIAN